MAPPLPPKLRAALRQVPPLRVAKSLYDLRYFQQRRDRRFGNGIAPAPPLQHGDWEKALEEELGYWRWSLEQGHFRDRLDPNRPLQRELARLLQQCAPPSGMPLLVDVGSGPLTTIGTQWTRPLRVMAIDPLAEQYNALMNEVGVTPPVRPVAGSAESLLNVVPADSADLVVMNNALDHSFQPLQCVLNLVSAAKVGGFVFLSHFANEAEREEYRGLHQWNVFRRGNDTIVSSTTSEHSLKELLAGQAAVSTRTKLELHGVVTTVIRKLR